MTNKPLRIVIGLQYYLPHRTGYSIYVQRVAEELVARGHQVTVLTARHKIELPRDETINGVRIIRLWAPIRVSRGMVMLAYPWSMWGLLRQNDVVWLHLPMLETALTAVLAQITGRGLVATHHGDLHLPEGFFNRFIEKFIFGLYAYMARYAHRIIGYSHDYADSSYYLKPFRDKVSIIYPPILMPEPDPERVAELRAQWQHDGGPIIGYAGRFVQEKRPDVLIRALDTINKVYPNARVVFAGEYDIAYEDTWEQNQHLVQKYKEQLIFLGLITSQQAMANFFGACDILVLPSESECFGFVQVEAMLSGTPVVMTDIPGGRVPVRETGMGKLVPPRDPEALGEAVIEILQNPQLYIRPRHEIEAIFNFDETVSRYEKHFRQARAKSRWGKRYHADS
ncbi:MAG: glycosyltransferase family 1 protein [Phototrophicales bacterium]|nr:MAG: glycosyltransferase family 1 protein [Phototrophicales bacterium]